MQYISKESNRGRLWFNYKDDRPIEFEDRTSSKKMGLVNIEYKKKYDCKLTIIRGEATN
jgi:hypothetical protein